MKSWKFHEFGAIENLQLSDVPVPEPVDGEALVKVEYAGLNPADKFLIMGKYPRPGKPPFSVGRDGSGWIEVPCRGGRFKKGDRVIHIQSNVGISREGTLSEYVCIPEASLAPLPDGWSSQEGAIGPLVHLTAWEALVNFGGISEGKTVLVTGASGGVGTAAVVQAKAFGAKVVALSRSQEKRQQLKELGADIVLDSGSENLVQEGKEALNGGRVDIVVENLGGPFLQNCIDLCGEGGRIGIVGLMAGLTSEYVVGKVIFKRIRIEGIQLGTVMPEEKQVMWEKIVEKLNGVGRRPLVDRVFPMNEVQEAFDYLDRGPMGKVVIDVAGSPS